MTNLNREKVSWSQETWNQIDQAVHGEAEATRIGRKFLPLHGPLDPGAQTISGQTIAGGATLAITPGQQIIPVEIWRNFTLNRQQMQDPTLAVALARRAANQVARAEDIIIFQGSNAGLGNVAVGQPNPGNNGLVQGANAVNVNQPLFQTLVAAMADLDAAGQHGPYALVVPPNDYANAHTPEPGTAVLPVDRIRPLVNAGFYNSTAVPNNVNGILVSLGGNSIDLAVTQDLTTAFVDENIDYNFRVFERFALRINDPAAVRLLQVGAAPAAAGGGRRDAPAGNA